MPTRADVAAAARTWIGTPWVHQQTLKGVGCDCAGLIRGVLIELGLRSGDLALWPGVQEFMGYGRVPDGHSIRRACDAYLEPIGRDALQVGDIVLNGWRLMPPQHLGIIVDRRYDEWVLVHAYPPKVIEERVSYERRLWRFVQGYRIPGVVA
jgi:cell wall-associated NlpC family hydrolase